MIRIDFPPFGSKSAHPSVKLPTGEGRWYEPLQAYTQEYALYAAVNFGIPWAETVQFCERGRTHPFREEKPCFGGCRALQETCEGRERERKVLI